MRHANGKFVRWRTSTATSATGTSCGTPTGTSCVGGPVPACTLWILSCGLVG